MRKKRLRESPFSAPLIFGLTRKRTTPRATVCEPSAGANGCVAKSRHVAKEAIKRKGRKGIRKGRKEFNSFASFAMYFAPFAFKSLLTEQLALKGSDYAGISQRAAARRARKPDRRGSRRAERIHCFQRRRSGHPGLSRRR